MENTPSTLAEAKGKIADLERQLAAAITTAQIYELRVTNLKSTLSWKLTAPFREIARAVTRISSGGQNFQLRRWFDRLAWKKFFREAERQFRLGVVRSGRRRKNHCRMSSQHQFAR